MTTTIGVGKRAALDNSSITGGAQMGDNESNHVINEKTFAHTTGHITSSKCGEQSNLESPFRRKSPLYNVASLVAGVFKYLSMDTTAHK